MNGATLRSAVGPTRFSFSSFFVVLLGPCRTCTRTGPRSTVTAFLLTSSCPSHIPSSPKLSRFRWLGPSPSFLPQTRSSLFLLRLLPPWTLRLLFHQTSLLVAFIQPFAMLPRSLFISLAPSLRFSVPPSGFSFFNERPRQRGSSSETYAEKLPFQAHTDSFRQQLHGVPNPRTLVYLRRNWRYGVRQSSRWCYPFSVLNLKAEHLPSSFKVQNSKEFLLQKFVEVNTVDSSQS